MENLLSRAQKKASRLLLVGLEAIPARLWRLAVQTRRLALPLDPKPQTLAVVRVDAIGDYLLFRGSLRVLRQSTPYRDWALCVIGNLQWRSVAEVLDGDVVDQWIWIDPTRYSRSPWYRAQVLAALPSAPFDTLIHPTFSRTRWADLLADDVLAQHKIAGTGDRVNKRWSVDRSGRIYTRLLPVDHGSVLFESDRNWEFVEKLLGSALPRTLPAIDPARLAADPRTPSGSFVVFHLDASRPEKEWPLDRYEALARYLLSNTNLSVVLLGQGATRSPWTVPDPRVVDLRDQTTLVQAGFLLSRAQGFVGNDSALLHLALAVQVPAAVGICFGQHFGRFVPYPGLGAGAAFVFPPKIEERLADSAWLQRRYADGSFEDIRAITVERVLDALRPCLRPHLR